MNRIFVAMTPLLLLASCTKQPIAQTPIDESEWLNQERGIVAAADFSCSYFVVETQRGFVFLRTWGAGTPLRGSVLYGPFSRWGVSTFYNRSGGYLMNADVRDNYLTWWDAMQNMDWNCGDKMQ